MTVASIMWTLHGPIASLLEVRIQDIQECWHNYCIILAMHIVCIMIIYIRMYLSIIYNFVTSLITFNALSMALVFMISLELFTRWKITITHSKDYPSTTAKMDISSIYQVSFICRLHVATSMCRLCVQFTYFGVLHLHVVLSIVLCSFV